jgi:5,5'-dehydrodivanillate O-demethylase
VFEHGIIKRRVMAGQTEEDDAWKRGHPILFPTILVVGALDAVNFQFRVPVDDTHTLHLFYTVNTPGIPIPPQGSPTVFQVPIPTEDELGVPQWEHLDTAPGQDMIAWITQGGIARRDKERLGLSDTGIMLFRKLLSDNIKKVQQGEEPMNVFRDPAQNVSIEIQTEHAHSGRPGGPAAKYSPLTPEVHRAFDEARKAKV